MSVKLVKPVVQSATRVRDYTQMSTFQDTKHEILWNYMHPSPRPCFNRTLLSELMRFIEQVKTSIDESAESNIQYLVLASKAEGVFNLGGDLNLFRHLVENQDRQGLEAYMRTCLDLILENYTHFQRDITTISLVQGSALGGGFECALSSNVVIAEKGTKMGFPEILFNLFPGMGAYSLLSRRLNPAQAERMILSGNLFDAEELYELGVIDVLAETGEGEMAVYDYVVKENRRRNGIRAMRTAKSCVNPMTYEELLRIGEVWVDAALRLTRKDLRMMERLISRQTQRMEQVA